MEASSQHGLGCSVYFVPIALTAFLIAWASSLYQITLNLSGSIFTGNYFNEAQMECEYLEVRHPDNKDDIYNHKF